MAALTDGAKIYKEDGRAAVRVLTKYMRADDRILEGGYKEYDTAISSPPYPGLKGLKRCATACWIRRRSLRSGLAKIHRRPLCQGQIMIR